MAKKKKYHIDPTTGQYKEIKFNFSYWLVRVLYHILLGLVVGCIFFLIFVTFIKSPNEKAMIIEKQKIEGQYKTLQQQMHEIQVVLYNLQERDDNLYRVVFQAEPIPITARHTPTSNIAYYNDLLKKTNSEIVVETSRKVNELRKQIYVQSKSYDEIILLAKSREKMLQSIPAIQPIANEDLKRLASGFGYRYDPIYHIRKFHEGMDFSAPVGAEIYATGNGKVVEASWKKGYGNCIDIDHQFGYKTRYAHLSRIKVAIGEKVIRGQVIGLVGNTGRSTGPHLHYEVHHYGKIMNPQNYYFLDLSPEEYDKVIQMSENSGQTMD